MLANESRRATLSSILGAMLLLASFAASTHRVAAQDASPTATAIATPTPPAGIRAFEIYPKGHVLGDYFAPTIDAGKSVDLVVVLANTGTVDFQGRTYATNAHTAVNGGFTISDKREAPSGVTLWLDYPEAVYDIAPGTGIERSFRVSVPRDTPPGQYITSLVLENAEPEAVDSAGGGNSFKQIVRFPVPVFITVPGPVTPGFEIGQPTIANTMTTSEIDIPIVNTGNVRVRPAGSVSILDASGKEVYNAPVGMGSVYAHDQTTLVIGLPGLLPAGDYGVKVELADPETKVTVGAILKITATAPATPAPLAPVQILSATGIPKPDADAIQFLDVSVVIDNSGDPLTNGQVVLRVAHDGQPVEDFPIASSLALPGGQTTVQARYIPATGWSKGSWTFQVIVEAVDPGTGVAQVLAMTDLAPLQVANP